MYSSQDSRCSHRLGSPIRKSPDHRLLASPRGLSQLATSFIAFLRQGIHTHALSSLTIKLTPHTILREVLLLALLSPNPTPLRNQTRANLLLPVRYSVVKDQFEKNRRTQLDRGRELPAPRESLMRGRPDADAAQRHAPEETKLSKNPSGERWSVRHGDPYRKDRRMYGVQRLLSTRLAFDNCTHVLS